MDGPMNNTTNTSFHSASPPSLHVPHQPRTDPGIGIVALVPVDAVLLSFRSASFLFPPKQDTNDQRQKEEVGRGGRRRNSIPQKKKGEGVSKKGKPKRKQIKQKQKKNSQTPPPRHPRMRSPRPAQHHIMLAVEKVSRVPGVQRHGLERLPALQHAAGPLPHAARVGLPR
jgi:hypothetical protein